MKTTIMSLPREFIVRVKRVIEDTENYDEFYEPYVRWSVDLRITAPNRELAREIAMTEAMDIFNCDPCSDESFYKHDKRYELRFEEAIVYDSAIVQETY